MNSNNNQNNTNYPGLAAPQFQVGVPQPQFQLLYTAPTSQPIQNQQPQFIQGNPQPFPQQAQFQTYPNANVTPQPQVVYFQAPPPQFSQTSVQQPFLQDYHPKARLLSQQYQVEIGHWISEGWHLFKEHWIMYSIFTLFYVLIAFIPYVGPIFDLLLYPGLLIAGLHQIRPNTHFQLTYFFHGVYYFFPILAISILYSLAVFFGFFLLIVPGIWLAVVLSFAPLIYVEHHDIDSDIGIMASFSISRKVVSKQFCSFFLFGLTLFFLNVLGALTIVGILITFPVSILASIIGFQHAFGLNPRRNIDGNCVCC